MHSFMDVSLSLFLSQFAETSRKEYFSNLSVILTLCRSLHLSRPSGPREGSPHVHLLLRRQKSQTSAFPEVRERFTHELTHVPKSVSAPCHGPRRHAASDFHGSHHLVHVSSTNPSSSRRCIRMRAVYALTKGLGGQESRKGNPMLTLSPPPKKGKNPHGSMITVYSTRIRTVFLQEGISL